MLPQRLRWLHIFPGYRHGIGHNPANVEAIEENLARVVLEKHGDGSCPLNVIAENLYGNDVLGRQVKRRRALIALRAIQVRRKRKRTLRR